MQNIVNNPEDFIKEHCPDGCLFVLEKYFDKLPSNWFDAFMFMYVNGTEETIKDTTMIVLGDEDSERILKISSLSEIPVFVLSDEELDGKKMMWNVMLTKQYIEDDPEPKKLFIGGENLRKYCDERNIYYRSCLSIDNELISASSLMWEKEECDDCRKPENITKSIQ